VNRLVWFIKDHTSSLLNIAYFLIIKPIMNNTNRGIIKNSYSGKD
jgi:hypothetical protein